MKTREQLAEENEKLKKLCEEYLVNYMIQEFAGAKPECIFCGARYGENQLVEHSTECPASEYKNIVN